MFGLVKVNAEKEKAEQHKCEFLSNWCLKCLLAKQLLDIKPVSGRILPPNATNMGNGQKICRVEE